MTAKLCEMAGSNDGHPLFTKCLFCEEWAVWVRGLVRVCGAIDGGPQLAKGK